MKKINTKQRILQTASELFASKGYDVLSMRDIATACNIKAPSLYNHFKDKQAIYQACLHFVFQEQGADLTQCLKTAEPAKKRLNQFIELACQQVASNDIFRQLFIRELLVQEETNMAFMVEEVMADTCNALHDVFIEIDSKCDPHFMTTSLMALLFFHFQIMPLRPYLPGSKENAQDLHYITEGIKQNINQYFV